MKAARRPTGTWRYMLHSDRELKPEDQSVFVLKPLTQFERMEVWDDLNWLETDSTGAQVVRPRANRQAYQLCLSNIASIENFPAGSPQKWPENGDVEGKKKYLELLDDLSILLIGTEIRQKSTLEEEVKNS